MLDLWLRPGLRTGRTLHAALEPILPTNAVALAAVPHSCYWRGRPPTSSTDSDGSRPASAT